MNPKSRLIRAIAALCLVTAVAAVGAGPAFAEGRHRGPPHGQSLYVSNRPDHQSGRARWNHHKRQACDNAAYSTISSAVAVASAGATVVVCPGTYTEDVVITKALTLIGRHATIDAAGLNNGVQIVTSDVRVRGFTITKAIGEGVLVGIDYSTDPEAAFIASQGFVLSNVAILNNDVVNDDQGFAGPGGSASTCDYLPLPSDCGGGIHFAVVSHSIISGNRVSGNADGVLLTDEYGPNFDNVVSKNWVADNATECGITLPSHNPGAVSFNPTTFQVTGRNPKVGGVYDNKIIDNVSIDNGTIPVDGSGSGAGVGIFAPFPGTGAYDNLVAGNYLAGNGLAGVTIHSHAPGQDVNGNVIVDNTVGTNNIDGDVDNGPTGPQDLVTTGISVFSAASPVQITIARNRLSSNDVGIWYTSSTVTASGLATNRFFKVTTPIQAA